MTRRIVVDVYEADSTPTNPLAFVDTLESDAGRTFLDDLADTGSFGLDVLAGTADETLLLTDGRFVRFSIDGTPRWWGMIEKRSKVSADPSARQAGRVISVGGRGALGVLDQAVVYPEVGLGRLSPENRAFDWTSTYFDDTAWGNAVELKQQNDPDPTKAWYNAPSGWKDPDAYWVGPAHGDDPAFFGSGGVPPGVILLRGSFTIGAGAGGEYRFDSTADDHLVLSVDADVVGETEQAAGMWGVTHSYPLLLDEGTHLVAVKATNFDRPVTTTNGFGVLLTVFKMLGGGVIDGPVIGRSSTGTKMLAYPATMPGLTPGHILKILLDEAHAAGYLLWLTYDFNETVDSNGVAWPAEIDISFPVGTTVLDVARRLFAERSCWTRIDPSTTQLTLQAFTWDFPDLSGSVSVTYGSNVGRLAHDRTPPGPNTVLTRTAEGRYIEVEDTAAVTAHGRRGAFLSLGAAPSDDAAARQVDAFLEDSALPADVITGCQVEVVPGGPAPFVDFNKGDKITATGFDGSPTVQWATGINVTEDVAGNPIYNLDTESVA